jgi:hypothetical protein
MDVGRLAAVGTGHQLVFASTSVRVARSRASDSPLAAPLPPSARAHQHINLVGSGVARPVAPTKDAA